MATTLPIEGWLVIYAAAHIALHFAAFVLWFRYSRKAGDERAVFLFHLASACVLSALALVVVVWQPGEQTIAAALTALFAHGIYSLTFLELWTLAQISYSRDVLERVLRGELTEDAIATLAQVGEAKRTQRLNALSTKGFIRHDEGRWTLTAKGRVAGRLLSIVLWLPAIRSPG